MSEAIIAGVVAAGLWTLVVLAFWAVRRRWMYWRLKGRYQARIKGNAKVEWELELRVAGRRLSVTGTRGDGARFEGEILMSDELPNRGRGHYFRSDAPDAYGFWDVQVVDRRKLLVHETFAKTRLRVVIVDGFVWERV